MNKHSREQRDQWEKQRLRVGRLLRRGRSQAEVARLTGTSKQSVSRWNATLQREGMAGLKSAKRLGRPASLSERDRRQLVQHLKSGAVTWGFATELWTLSRIAQVIEREFGPRFTESWVARLLGQLGWSCQRPERQARERDEQAIRQWKQEGWPQLKKARRDKDV